MKKIRKLLQHLLVRYWKDFFLTSGDTTKPVMVSIFIDRTTDRLVLKPTLYAFRISHPTDWPMLFKRKEAR